MEASAWIVMENGGVSLATVKSKSGGFLSPQLKVFVRDVAEALAHLHGVGFVHSDVKPPNILASPDQGGIFRFLLADLGSCLAVVGGSQKHSPS
jgi:serine/threonine protein kinase